MTVNGGIVDVGGKDTELVYELQIGGSHVRWVSRIDAQQDPGSAIYTYERGIDAASVRLGPSTLPSRGGFGSSGRATLRLLDVRDSAYSAPRVLTRVASKGAGHIAYLQTQIQSTTDPVLAIVVGTDPVGWDTDPITGRYIIHIGQETFLATAISGAGPWQFDTAITRARYDSRRQTHVVEAARAVNPRVTGNLINWLNRPASLRAANRRQDGSISAFFSLVDGYLEETPRILDDGSIEVTIIPEIEQSKKKIGGGDVETDLVWGYHYFEPTIQAVGRRILMSVGFREGDVFSTEIKLDAIAGAGQIRVGDVSAWEDVFSSGWARDAPMRGGFKCADNKDLIPGVGGASSSDAAGVETFLNIEEQQDTGRNGYGAGPIAAVEEGDVLRSSPVRQLYLFFAPQPSSGGVTKWPAEVVENTDSTGWNDQVWGGAGLPGKASPNGRLARLNLSQQMQLLYSRVRSTLHARPPHVKIQQDWFDLWYGCNWSRPGEDQARRKIADGQKSNVRPLEEIGAKGIDGADTRHDLSGPALGYYQSGERYLLVNDSLHPGGAVTVPLLITWEKPDWEGAPTEAYAMASAQAIAYWHPTAPEEQNVGYLLTLDTADPQDWPASFGDWTERQVKVRVLAAWKRATPTDICRQILASVDGTTTNGADDVQPYGMGVVQTRINLTSFTGDIAPPPDLAEWTLEIREATTIEDLLGPMLRVMDAAIVTRLNPATGIRQLALASVGLENWVDSVGTIAADEWADEWVTTETEKDVVNRFEFAFNYSAADEKFLSRVTWTDSGSKGELGGKIVEQKEELRGIYLDYSDLERQSLAFAPLFSSKRASYGEPRRRIRGVLSYARGVRMDPGSIYMVSSTHARGYDGSLGVTAQAMRVVSVDSDPVERRTTVELEYHGANATGWAPALEVTAVVSPTIVEVAANAYTAATHPITGEAWTDLQAFSAVDSVMCAQRGNWAATLAAAPGAGYWLITTIDTGLRRVTLSAAHGLAVGDTIRPAAYDDSAAHHRAMAFLADASSTLGTGNIAAYDWDV